MWPAASASDGQPRAGLDADAGAQRAGHARPAEPVRLGHDRLAPELQPQAGVGGHRDRRAGRDLGRVDQQRHAAVLAGVQPHGRLLEAQRARQRCVARRCARLGWCRRLWLWLGRCGRRGVRRRAAALEAGAAGRVERAAQHVVERAQPDLVARLHGASGTDEMRAGAPLLGGDDRPQHALDPRIKLLHDRVVLVQAGAIDLDDDVRARRVERRALEFLQRLADHLAVEVARARLALVAGERRLVRRAAGADHQAAEPGRPRRAQRDRLRRAPDDDARPHAARDLDLLVGQQRPLRIGLGCRQRHELRALARAARATAAAPGPPAPAAAARAGRRAAAAARSPAAARPPAAP